MATVLNPNPTHRGDLIQLPALLRYFGVETKLYPGWDQRGHGDFGRIWGVVAHHTGSNNTPASYIAKHPQLGLCAQIHLDRAGVATICGIGVAWHAGQGNWEGIEENNANRCTIGIEAVSNGKTPWPEKQLDAYYRCAAAILWYLGHDASHVIGHKEWARGYQYKWDPGLIDMTEFRARVQKLIDHPPTHNSTPAPPAQTMTAQHILASHYPSLINPNVSFTPTDLLRVIDMNTWTNRALLEAIAEKIGLNPQVIVEDAIAKDRAK